MTKGRPKTPLALKIVRGTYRPDRDGKLSDHVAGTVLTAIPTPPAALGETGKAKWTTTAEVLQSLGLLEDRFLHALECYCRAWDALHGAEADLAEQGSYFLAGNGKPRPHPAHLLAQHARDEIRKYQTEFGFTPSSSPRVTTSGGTNRKPAVPTRKSTYGKDPL